VAVAFPVTGVLVYLASVGELRRLWESGFLWGAAGSLLPTGIWLWAASPRGGPDAWAVIQTQVLERVGRGMHHPRPIYYYLYSLPLEFLPWTPFLAGAVAITFPFRERDRRRTLLFLYAWLVGGIALLSASVEKRPGYLLPLFPILSLLVGRLLADHLLGHDPEKLRRWIEIPLAGYAAIVAGGGAWALAHSAAYPGLYGRLLPLVILYFTACAGAVVLLRNRRRVLALLVFSGGLMAGYLGIAGGILPWLDTHKSARPFCERVVGRIGDSPLAVYRDPRPALSYYTHRPLPVLRTPASLRQWLAGPRNGYVLIEGGDFEDISKSDRLRVLDREAVGEKIYLLAAREPDPATGGSPR
jgi:4-amino-4-deoxy-L-arabinose transferase-like glycosyltransferase